MPELAKLILAAMAALLVKHAIADFFLQFAYQHRNKGRYGHPGGLLHSFIHVVLTAPVFLIITPTRELVAAILIGEFIVHYHVDWMKERVKTDRGWKTTDAAFWQALGIDQLLHGLTYVVIVAILVSW